jgi:Cu2+-exporting ATPase
MTCNGCRSHVEETLAEVKGVSNVSVDLEKAEAAIEMEKHIPLATFQLALKEKGGRYSIHNTGDHPHKGDNPMNNREQPASKAQGAAAFYCPMHYAR